MDYAIINTDTNIWEFQSDDMAEIMDKAFDYKNQKMNFVIVKIIGEVSSS